MPIKTPFQSTVLVLSVRYGLILCEYHNVILIDKTDNKNEIIQPENAQQYYDASLTEIYGKDDKTVLCFDKNSTGTDDIKTLLTHKKDTDIIDYFGNLCEDGNGCIDAIFTKDNRLKILVHEGFEAWVKSQI